jgi:nucleoid-associated protein YgaU
MSSSALIRSGTLPSCIARVGASMLGLSMFTAIGARAQDASQDVAEAARQQRARKAASAQSLSPTEGHIYTNEDLRRSRILLEEDLARVAARKQNALRPSAVPAETGAVAAGDAPNASAGESLGAVARRYRREEREREAKQARVNPPASQFHLEVPTGALAEVVPGVALHVAPHAVPHVAPNIAPQGAPRGTSSLPAAVLPSTGAKTGVRGLALRRDPFSRPAIGLARKQYDSSKVILAGPAVRSPASPKNVPSSFAATKSLPLNDVGISSVPEVAARPAPSARMPAGVDAGAAVAGTVIVRSGDSLWKLSRRYSGSAVRWREWLQRNPELGDPRSLRVGAVLFVPPREGRSALGLAPVLRGPARSVVVRSGDSLWRISAERYGDGARWLCVARANAGLRDTAVIFPGQRLLLPADCANLGHP